MSPPLPENSSLLHTLIVHYQKPGILARSASAGACRAPTRTLPHSRSCGNLILSRDRKPDICGCAHVMLTHQLSFHLSDKSADAPANRRGSAGTGEAGWGCPTAGTDLGFEARLVYRIPHCEEGLTQLQMFEDAAQDASVIQRKALRPENYLHQQMTPSVHMGLCMWVPPPGPHIYSKTSSRLSLEFKEKI